MAEFHFVEDYERLVADLIAKHPIEEAMSLAVGGYYDQIGQVEGHLLRWAGLANGMSVVDLGCGSGRLAHALGKAFAINYLGVDIVQALLDYAATKSPTNYSFVLNRSLTLPADEKSADFVTAFSVFTHLLPSESYLYMEDARRVLKRVESSSSASSRSPSLAIGLLSRERSIVVGPGEVASQHDA